MPSNPTRWREPLDLMCTHLRLDILKIRHLSNVMEESSNCYQRQQESLHEDSQARTDYSDSATTSHHHLDS